MHTVMPYLVGFAVGLPIGGVLTWAFGSYLKADVQKVETAVTNFKGNKASGK